MKAKIAVEIREALNRILGFNYLKGRETALLEIALKDYEEELIKKICDKLHLKEELIRGILNEENN